MSEHSVLFLPHNKKVTVPYGHNLIRAAMEAGVHINASCGGEGVCGKCRVMIEDGTVGGGISGVSWESTRYGSHQCHSRSRAGLSSPQ